MRLIGAIGSSVSSSCLDLAGIVLTMPSPDDPDLWKTQPMTLQIVGRPYRDETLIANCELIDEIVNACQ